MDFLMYTQRRSYFLELIRRNALGSPKEVAKRFFCSERTVRRIISNLKKEGYPIRYDRNINRYYLDEEIKSN